MTLLAFDTSYLYFRAFFGVPTSVTAPDGTPVNAVRGTLDAVAKLVETYAPDHVAMAWDEDWRPAWRTDLVPSYKAHRVLEPAAEGVDVEETPDLLAPQVPVLREVLDALGVPAVGVAGYEADDVLGSAARRHDGDVLVVSGDRDLFQLVDQRTRVVYIGRGVSRHELVDDAWLQRSYGLDGSRYSDFAVLRGDASDGLPGVRGIGEKTAAKLLGQFSSLDALVEAARSGAPGLTPTQRRTVADEADYILPAKQVVDVVTTLDVTTTPLPSSSDPGRLESLDERWGLGSSLARAVAALGSAGPQQVDG